MPEYAVQVDGLTRRFGEFVAVDHVSFAVAPGEIFGFLGPNGAGKSTTIRILCGLLAPSGGAGHVGGFNIRRQQEQIKQHIGYMSQRFSLYNDLTVAENLNFYGGIYGLSGARLRERQEWALEMAGLTQRRSALTGTLAGGWKQRLALGCAILHEPRILFLDEPTSGVDPISRRGFWDLIYTMAADGVTVFVTTHYMDEAEYCDRIGLIFRGQLIALGAPEQLKTQHMRGAILDVTCARPQDALEMIETLPGVKEAALFGCGLHVVTLEPERAEAVLRSELPRRGFTLSRLERISPALEDVFVSLIEQYSSTGEGRHVDQ